MKSAVMKYFPFSKPLKAQTSTIEAIEKAFKDFNFVILESPVGSGKSAMALTLAKYYGSTHILTPRKSLQNQYYEDFHEDIVLMKGRSAYPCTRDFSETEYRTTLDKIRNGYIQQVQDSEASCAKAPCVNNRAAYNTCTEEETKPCPYQVAIDTACGSDIIVHNVHSFIYQANFGQRFSPRDLLIVDECHELESILRDFVKTTVTLRRVVKEEEYEHLETVEDWAEWLKSDEFVPKSEDDQEKYLENLGKLNYLENGKFVLDVELVKHPAMPTRTRLVFTPDSIGKIGQQLIFDYGVKVLLMSGTIYDKEYFCRLVGINNEDATFIRVGSSFPVRNRPIVMKSEYQVDTSFKGWNENKEKLGQVISKIMNIFGEDKGLIQVPSYYSSREIKEMVDNPDRLITHEPETFLDSISDFFEEETNNVFVSPVCQQGVDFKEDRARFQIILRVPYLNTSDKFIQHKVKTDFRWYNYQALVTFGQQIGRVNRTPDDFGVTFLVDSRFPGFINKNRRHLPKWLLDAVQT